MRASKIVIYNFFLPCLFLLVQLRNELCYIALDLEGLGAL